LNQAELRHLLGHTDALLSISLALWTGSVPFYFEVVTRAEKDFETGEEDQRWR
jgi:hypothetical protein